MLGKLALVTTLVAMALGIGTPASGYDDAGVRGGRAGVFVVRGGSEGTGEPAGGSGSGCADTCPRTVLTRVCAVDRWGVLPQPGSGECLEVPGLCPEGQVARRVWTEGPGGWVPGAQQCLEEGAAVPVEVIAAELVERVRHRPPPLQPVRQPRRRALVRLPVLFDSGQPGGSRTWTDVVAGFTVTTTVSPRWEWDFGDGDTLTTTSPGSRYPDMTVSHRYESPGTRFVRVTTTWDGTFTIAGAGTFPIAGEVVQQADLQTVVVEARAVLVPDRSVPQPLEGP